MYYLATQRCSDWLISWSFSTLLGVISIYTSISPFILHLRLRITITTRIQIPFLFYLPSFYSDKLLRKQKCRSHKLIKKLPGMPRPHSKLKYSWKLLSKKSKVNAKKRVSYEWTNFKFLKPNRLLLKLWSFWRIHLSVDYTWNQWHFIVWSTL